MSVSAHTNQVGGSTISDVFTDERRFLQAGFPWQGVDPIPTRDPFTAFVGYSYKSPTIRSDHKSPTDYARVIRKVVQNDPRKATDVIYRDDKDPSYAFIMERKDYLLRDYSLFEVLHPARFLSDLEDCRAEAQTQARNRLREGRVSNGADLAQARQSVNMISQDAARVLRALNALRRGNVLEAARILGLSWKRGRYGSLADLWLELQYGWKPLLNSIHDNASLLGKGGLLAGSSVKSSAQRQTSYEYTDVRGRDTISVKCHGGVRTAYSAWVRYPGIVRADTLGLINPAEVAWELVPFSFVVDWFIPVGNVLQSLTATAGLEMASGYTSVRSQTDFHVSRDGGGTLHMTLFSFERFSHTNFVLPSLYGSRNPFTTGHALNALALLGQMAQR